MPPKGRNGLGARPVRERLYTTTNDVLAGIIHHSRQAGRAMRDPKWGEDRAAWLTLIGQHCFFGWRGKFVKVSQDEVVAGEGHTDVVEETGGTRGDEGSYW